MNARHDDPELDRMESDPDYVCRMDGRLVRAFRRVMMAIRDAPNETALYRWKALRFEKLKGNRDHQRSMRLNDQWRLIVEIEERSGGNVMVIKGIEDYH